MKEIKRSTQDQEWVEQKQENRRLNLALRHNVWDGGIFYRQLVSARRVLRGMLRSENTKSGIYL